MYCTVLVEPTVVLSDMRLVRSSPRNAANTCSDLDVSWTDDAAFVLRFTSSDLIRLVLMVGLAQKAYEQMFATRGFCDVRVV